MSLVGDSRDNDPTKVKPSASGKCRARHARILDGDPLAIRVTNLRARLGLKPQKISRFDN